MSDSERVLRNSLVRLGGESVLGNGWVEIVLRRPVGWTASFIRVIGLSCLIFVVSLSGWGRFDLAGVLVNGEKACFGPLSASDIKANLVLAEPIPALEEGVVEKGEKILVAAVAFAVFAFAAS